MHDRYDADFSVAFVDFVNDYVWAFDEFAGAGVSPDPPYARKLGQRELFELLEYAVDQGRRGRRIVLGDPGEDALEILQRFFMDHDPHTPKPRNLFRLEGRVPVG
jgi:hypothetical protein